MNLVRAKGASSQFVEDWFQYEPVRRGERPFVRKNTKKLKTPKNEERSRCDNLSIQLDLTTCSVLAQKGKNPFFTRNHFA
jgi:hypothetical protein